MPARKPGRPPARPHWLRGVGATKTPAVVVCFDTETTATTDGEDELHSLRVWCALTRVRHPSDVLPATELMASGTTAAGLADTLEAACGLTGEAWVLAHNIGFDLAVTSLPDVLSDRGWAVQFANIGDESCVFVLKRPGRRLVLTDAWAWLHCSLQDAAHDLGMRKGRLPAADAGDGAWERHCAHDAAMLDRVVCSLLDWWDTQPLGAFGVTAASCGWRTLRAKVPIKTVLVGPDGERTAAGRRAIHSGRREVYQVGEINGVWVDDWDLEAAHLTTMASVGLPCRPIQPGAFTAAADPLDPPAGAGAVADVTVTTQVPCAPCRVDGDVWWPVGKFTTTLTSAELPLVASLAGQVRVHRAWWWRLTDDLRPWGRWCLALQRGEGGPVPGAVRRAAKGWGRSVPGRFAMQTSVLVGERPATHPGWAVETGTDLVTGQPLELVTFGGVEHTWRRGQDGRDCSPVVLAFVEGTVRATLGRLIQSRPAGSVLQVNTDGWWERRAPGGLSRPPVDEAGVYRLVRKASARRVSIQGPNHLETPTDRRLSGVPADAEARLDGSFTFRNWPGLRWQLEFSRPGVFRRPFRELRLSEHYVRRWVLEDGSTVPVAATVDPSGATVLLPWALTPGRPAGAVLAEHQVPALQALRDEPAGPA